MIVTRLTIIRDSKINKNTTHLYTNAMTKGRKKQRIEATHL